MSLSKSLNALQVTFREFDKRQAIFDDRMQTAELPRLQNLIQKLDQSRPPRQPKDHGRFMKYWHDWLSGTGSPPSSRAIRYLCWEPEAATDQRFLTLVNDGRRLSAQSIHGLVYSRHARWREASAQNSSFPVLLEVVRRFSGRNRLIAKWKSHVHLILSGEGPVKMAAWLRNNEQPVSSFCQEFGISEDTEFVGDGVTDCCRLFSNEFEKNNAQSHTYFIEELLHWRLLPPGDYKKYVAEAVLSRAFVENDRFSQLLLSHVLNDARLGDPRLRGNAANWAPINPLARERVVNALSKDDILFFFDNVMTSDVDRHGRKKFWLRYVSKLRQSRPLLADSDRIRLAGAINRRRSRSLHFGRTRGQYSAFLLDFGDVLAIEFNDVGACYIYQRHKSRLFPDIYRDDSFTDHELKQATYAEDRIRHAGTWEWRLASALAQFGIRP